jgi:hypothetical protein
MQPQYLWDKFNADENKLNTNSPARPQKPMERFDGTLKTFIFKQIEISQFS